MPLLEGLGFDESKERLSTVRHVYVLAIGPVSHSLGHLLQAYVPTLLRNWAVFGPAQLVNFAFVPPQLRFVFISTISLFWSESRLFLLGLIRHFALASPSRTDF